MKALSKYVLSRECLEDSAKFKYLKKKLQELKEEVSILQHLCVGLMCCVTGKQSAAVQPIYHDAGYLGAISSALWLHLPAARWLHPDY